jgi:hypothetical protein
MRAIVGDHQPHFGELGGREENELVHLGVALAVIRGSFRGAREGWE